MFHKASASYAAGNQCVEVARVEDAVNVRDSTDPTGPVLRFTKDEWRAFLTGVRNDEFDV